MTPYILTMVLTSSVDGSHAKAVSATQRLFSVVVLGQIKVWKFWHAELLFDTAPPPVSAHAVESNDIGSHTVLSELVSASVVDIPRMREP